MKKLDKKNEFNKNDRSIGCMKLVYCTGGNKGTVWGGF